MWGYIVFAFPFIRSFVHTYVRSFVRSFVFRHRVKVFCVKVYKTSYFEDPLMDFVHIWGQGHGLRIFIKKSQGQSFCVKVYKTSNFKTL